MRLSTCCSAAFDVQRHELTDYLIALCENRSVDPSLATKVIRALDTLDPLAFARIQRSTLERFPEAGRGNSYLDFCHHISKAMRLYLGFFEKNKRIRKFLEGTRPNRKILDIGSGSGSFSFLCNALGHHATGLEKPQRQKSDDGSLPLKYLLPEWYNVECIEHEIEPGVPFPIDDRSFDDFVMFYPTFHRRWKERDWAFLFSDLTRCATKDDSRLNVRMSKPKVKEGGVIQFSDDEFSRAVAGLNHYLIEDRSYVIDLK